ncbi:MAG: hypothetical protein IJ666_04835 [Ruminococcus sp.]|nr:hypothetical protein [Ruminococcus sp.]
MKIIKTVLYVLAADILSLFIDFTLASSSMFIIRLICAVCTFLILAVILSGLAVSTANQDLKDKRINNKKINIILPLSMGTAASFPAAVSWCVLKFSMRRFDFYRWHKIINGYFLQIYNFIEPDASSSALSTGEVNIMLILVFIPVIIFLTAYFLVYKGIIHIGK